MLKDKQNMNSARDILLFFASLVVLYILFLGKTLFVPFIIALVIWYLISTLAYEYEDFKIPHWVALIFSTLTFIVVIWLISWVINLNINDLIVQGPVYQTKFENLVTRFVQSYGLEGRQLGSQVFEYLNVSSFISTLTGAVTSIAGSVSLIIAFLILIFLEQRTFDTKIKELFKSSPKYKKIKSIRLKINNDLITYVKIKTLTSFSTGIISYIVLKLFGVDFAEFWGLLLFILNYIPTFGSIVAVTFPMIIALIQFQNPGIFTILLIILISIQMTIGNIVEPRLMGKTLNISPLVILFSLVIWGWIWGVIGMFLSVPIMVMLIVILPKFDSTKWIAVLLSADGKVE